MSRMHNYITIQPVRNGFIVEGTANLSDRNVAQQPATYVFESLPNLFEWLELNYHSGEQPENNGAL